MQPIAQASVSPTDPFDGYTRSCYVKQKFVQVEYPAPDGNGVVLRKVPSGLIDNSNEWLGDQMVRMHMKITHDHDFSLSGFAERARKRLLARHKRRQM